MLTDPRRRVQAVSRNVLAWAGPLRPEYLRSRNLVASAAVAFWLGTWYQVLRGSPRTSAPARWRAPGATTGPPSVVVAHYGSLAARDLGILGRGSPAIAVRRVVAHADRQPPGVAAPALYVLAVAATLTPGPDETFSEALSQERVASWLARAEGTGARLILGFQPVRQTFVRALQPFEHLLRLPNVGIGLQPAWRQPEPGGATPASWPHEELDEALDWLSGSIATDPPTMVLVHSTPGAAWPDDWAAGARHGLDVVGIADLVGTLDDKQAALGRLARRAPTVGIVLHLRADPEAIEPAEALRLWPGLRVVVYR